MFRHSVTCTEAINGEFAVSDDDGQDVVEVVRHAAGQASDGAHSLRLSKLVLETTGFSDVLCYGEDAGGAIDVDSLSRHVGFADLARLGAQSGIESATHARVFELLKQFRAIESVNPDSEFRRTATDDIAALEAEHLQKCVIDIDVTSVGEGTNRDRKRTRAESLGEKILTIAPVAPKKKENNQDEDEIQSISKSGGKILAGF